MESDGASLTAPQPYTGEETSVPPECLRVPPSAGWNVEGFDQAEIRWSDSTSFRAWRKSINSADYVVREVPTFGTDIRLSESSVEHDKWDRRNPCNDGAGIRRPETGDNTGPPAVQNRSWSGQSETLLIAVLTADRRLLLDPFPLTRATNENPSPRRTMVAWVPSSDPLWL